jgi:predicted SPOUT superfamily RNA methylase MTH1
MQKIEIKGTYGFNVQSIQNTEQTLNTLWAEEVVIHMSKEGDVFTLKDVTISLVGKSVNTCVLTDEKKALIDSISN